MRTMAVRFVLAAAMLAFGVMAVRTAAQGNRGAHEDVLPALLTEVRGLRAAMEQMASAGPRVQLALGRLQLQEQRVNTMLRRLETVRDSMATAQNRLSAHQSEIAHAEEQLKTASLSAQQREGLENLLIDVKRHLDLVRAEVSRLTAEEASVANDIANEQARWTDFNQRLEELDRALTRRQ
jgi:chromosome segregation ATPase